LIEINLDRAIFALLCLYALLVPFELALEILLGIKTIFKPYRIVCLLLIVLFGIKQLTSRELKTSVDLKTDVLLYALFGYGIMVSFISMIVAEFSLSKFYNEIFQTGLYISIFVIVKGTPLNEKKLRTLINYLVVGISLNALYVVYNYYWLRNLGRQSGFFDNPNYLSLSIIFAIAAILIYLRELRLRSKLLLIAALPMLMAAFTIAGSRAGFFVIIAVLLVVLFYQNWLTKAIIAGGFLLFATYVFSTGDQFSRSSANQSVLASRLSDREIADDPRFPIWKGVIRASQQTYFIGLGLGQFEARFPEFYREENNLLIYEILNYGYHLSPHSDYMAVLITYGIIGLLLFLIFYFLSFLRLFRQLANNSGTQFYSLYQIQLAGLITVVLFGVASENFVSGLFWIILTLSTKSFEEKINE
jgi:O-antigen ligase